MERINRLNERFGFDTDHVFSPSAGHVRASQHSPEFACSSVRGLRREMEDQHIAERPLLPPQGGENANLFGVFDGHGGQLCSQFLHDNLAAAVRKNVASHAGEPAEALKAAFRDTDVAFLNSISSEEVGSTAVVVMLLGRTLYCANTGDSRAILCRANETVCLSEDHKPNRADEKKRIEDAGGCVLYNRVMGRLGVSRAFGDKSLKTYVIADPDIVTLQLAEGDDFLVIACDGLWDVVDVDTVTTLVRTHAAAKGLESAAQALTTYAIRNGSHDNVTCMIVALGSGSGDAPR